MLGETLRKAREAIGLRQRDAAEALGISDSGVSEIESGVRELKASQLAILAKLYRRSVEFFLGEEPAAREVVLWRCQPSDEEHAKAVQREFLELCENYHTLEQLTGTAIPPALPTAKGAKEKFGYSQAEALAARFWTVSGLGSVPAASLRSVLEERYGVKIFALPLEDKASALCTRHEVFGPCILLNQNNVSWRRNYDLAHELFHLLTWSVFRGPAEESAVQAVEWEESLANAFASHLLLPDAVFRERIDRLTGQDDSFIGKVRDVHSLAREFEVSSEAVVYRIAGLLRWSKEKTKEIVAGLRDTQRTSRKSAKEAPFSDRYVDLAKEAYRNGLVTFSRAAGFLRMTPRKAERVLEPSEGDIEFDAPITVHDP